MKLYLWSIFLFLICHPAFAGGSVIGNGGDGVYDPAKRVVLLRDLLEAGIQSSPWIGSSKDPRITELIYSASLEKKWDLNIRLDLLIRKLTDLQQSAPPLGQIIAEGIRLYQWEKVDQPLAFVDDGTILNLPSGTQRVQIGNRLLKTIRYDDTYFSLLPEEQKVAFVIHEIVYSLLRPQCSAETGFCKQLAIVAREIVGHAFSDNRYGKMTAILRADMGELSIPEDLGPRGGSFEWWLWEEIGPSRKIRSLDPTAMRSIEALETYLSSECRVAWEISQDRNKSPLQLFSEIHVPSFQVQFSNYREALSDVQYGLSVVKTETKKNRIHIQFSNSEFSPDDCINTLSPHVQKAAQFLY